jgi:hypothetical protein
MATDPEEIQKGLAQFIAGHALHRVFSLETA